MSNLALVQLHHNEPMTTSLAIAEGVNMDHASVIKLVRKYVNDLQKLGGVGFEIQPFETSGGTQWREIAFLNEQQATFLLTLMRNTEIVIAFKLALVRAFFELRDRPSIPERDDPLTLSHRADIAVQASRTFNAMLRSARHAGLPMAKALREANATAIRKTGVDILAELNAEDLPQQHEPQTPVVTDIYGVRQFMHEWLTGILPLPVVVCSSSELYTAYDHWATVGGARHVASDITFHRLTRIAEPYLIKTKVRIILDGLSKVTNVVIPPKGERPQPGEAGIFYAQQIARFSAALLEWLSAA